MKVKDKFCICLPGIQQALTADNIVLIFFFTIFRNQRFNLFLKGLIDPLNLKKKKGSAEN